MTKILKINPRRFSKTKFFPGCAGNPFDRLLHSLEKLEDIPNFLFVTILILFAFIGGLPSILHTHNLQFAFILLLLVCLDLFLINLLPKYNLSYGPKKITTFWLAALRIPFAWLPMGWNLGFEIAGTLLVFYGFFIEPFRIDIHHEALHTGKLSIRGSFKVLHLGDLHIERTTKRELMAIQKIEQLKPDLILFSGDVLNLSYLSDPLAQADAIAFFKRLSAPYGVYGVTGSPAVDSSEFFKRLAAETLLCWLNNEVAEINTPAGRIQIIGLSCSHNPDFDENNLEGLVEKVINSNHGVNLLLYHSPDLAPNTSQFNIDLQLSGHTHGGQVCLPFFGPIYTGSLYGRIFKAGRYLVNGMPLYITRGLGMEGAIAPRVRFLCPPEMIIWEIENKLLEN